LATGPGKRAINDPDLRDRLYELLEHDHPPDTIGSRFVRLIVALIVVDVLAAILASVPELDASFGRLFTTIEIVAGTGLERGRAFTAPRVADAGAARIHGQ
jgi:voltage-gated potassium channel